MAGIGLALKARARVRGFHLEVFGAADGDTHESVTVFKGSNSGRPVGHAAAALGSGWEAYSRKRSGKQKELGYFPTLEAAVSAVMDNSDS
ncbi:hypothetical protein ACQB60_34910 [Actinomycetota bacterium Odt1-20B]